MNERTMLPPQTTLLPNPTFARTSLLQRRCACGGTPGPDGECAECRRKLLARQAHSTARTGHPGAPPIVHEVLRSPGKPLDADTRAYMEPRFGHRFSQVRVHTDARAAESARAVNALAYTVGRDIVFRVGQYRPESDAGKRLLAHELTHVLQQGQGSARLHRTSAEPGASSADQAETIEVTRVDRPLLSRQNPPYPGAISRCRSMGVPCPAPHFHHGTVCRLVDCDRSKTANLPFAISPGICIYHCLDGQVCTCVLLGSASSAVCVLTLCASPGQSSAEPDHDALVDRALSAAEQQLGGQTREGERSPVGATPTVQAKLEVNRPGDLYEQEADRIAEKVMLMTDPASPPQIKRAGSSGETLRRRSISPLSMPEEERDDELAEGEVPETQGGDTVRRTGAPLVQRAPLGDALGAGPRGTHPGGTLPYREATRLLDCIRIMGEANAEYCRQEALGEQPAPPPLPPPVVCEPDSPLTWANFRGTPAAGSFGAETHFHHDLVTEQGKQITRATFESANSWVRPQFRDPTNRTATRCAANISNCERFFDREAAAGRTGGTWNLTPPAGCAASAAPDPSIAATSRAECASVIGPECDRVAAAESARLLRHEQLHFDIACVVARKGTTALALVPANQAQTIISAVRTKANALTVQYDTQTVHGCDAAAQASWESDVQNDLPAVTIP